MAPEETKPESESVPTPAPKTGRVGTGIGCLALVIGCCFALFAALAYGMGHANNQGNEVFQSVLIGAPIVTLVLAACWIALRHRSPK